jgi:hypothetical protein
MTSDNIYERYYTQQAGNGLDVYGGVSSQKGHGLGSILGGLFRGAMPILKNVGKAVGKQILNSGLAVANDVASGEGVKKSIKRRAKEGTLSLLTSPQKNKRSRESVNPVILRKKVARRRRRQREINRDIFT